MKDLILKLSTSISRLINVRGGSHLGQYILLFDSSLAAEESAFMLNGQWDQCNGVVLSKHDKVAVDTVASLTGARWCYSGDHAALLIRLSVDELMKRYASGDRQFVNANLRGARLDELNLSEANLSWAKLTAASLRGATLKRASLCKADLREANLSRANLGFADLSGANLTGATLNGTNLFAADLRRTDLAGAVLTGAKLPSGRVCD